MIIIMIILDTGQTKFHLCVCNVGDSLAYVYSDGQVITLILILTLLETFQNHNNPWLLIFPDLDLDNKDGF